MPHPSGRPTHNRDRQSTATLLWKNIVVRNSLSPQLCIGLRWLARLPASVWVASQRRPAEPALQVGFGSLARPERPDVGVPMVVDMGGREGGKRTAIYIYNQLIVRQMEVEDNQRFFTDFVVRMPLADPHTMRVDVDQFRQQHPKAAEDLIKNPQKYYRIAKNHLERNEFGDQRPRFDGKVQHYRISFEGNLGANFVTPRGLGSKMANELVGIQGIITKMDVVKYYLEKSIHFCEKTKAHEVKEYPDNMNPEKQFEPNKTRFIRTHDENNNPLSFQYGLSSFRNIQYVVIQELPENAPPGLLPQSVTVVLQDQLVNSVKPGDRVQMIGIYKLIGGSQSKEKGIFKPYFICLSVKQLSQAIRLNVSLPKIPFQPSQIVRICSRSVAPSIYGHEELKKAVLLMLLGGQEKNLDNGTHLRGDVNVLMVGDPGTAKSQILRWVLSTAELAIGTTGSGASGVGLTAAVVSDKDTGEKTLEAGAMVLADRGVVCIDEFDKMNEIDRVAVHEVMEQQTVTIAKAGMHCSLNARCSVIAAANPIYGEYQPQFAPTKNIGMPDSLLSRFDLVFIILDEKSAQKDKKIADRVCRNHRLAPKVNESFNRFHEDDDYVIHPAEQSAKNDQVIFEKNSIYQQNEVKKTGEILEQNYLRKYISFCKHSFHPELSDDSIELLSQLWNLLRQRDQHEKTTSVKKVLPITIRSFETLIRLSTAHAKLHQSNQIEIRDCVEAFRLMIYCIEGDSHALDSDLREILKKLGLEDGFSFDKGDERPKGHTKQAPKKEVKKMEDEAKGLVSKMSKIDINKDEREAERIIRLAMSQDSSVTKQHKSMVFRAINDLQKNLKLAGGAISIRQIWKKLDLNEISSEEIGAALRVLDQDGRIHFDENSGKIYM